MVYLVKEQESLVYSATDWRRQYFIRSVDEMEIEGSRMNTNIMQDAG